MGASKASEHRVGAIWRVLLSLLPLKLKNLHVAATLSISPDLARKAHLEGARIGSAHPQESVPLVSQSNMKGNAEKTTQLCAKHAALVGLLGTAAKQSILP
jgi:hypothetical protein